MAITLVAVGTGGPTSTNLPAWIPGDVAIVHASFDGAGGPFIPGPPAGWTAIGAGGSGGSGVSGIGQRGAFRVLQTGDTTTGNWTNAGSLIVVILRGVDTADPIGGIAGGTTPSGQISFSAITMEITNGSSWVLSFAKHKSMDIDGLVPSGMTLLGSGSAGEHAGWYLANTASFTARTIAVTNDDRLATSYEIRASTLTQVNKDLATSWNVLAAVGKSLATSWAVDEALSAVGRSLATSWGMTTAVGRELVTSWLVQAATGFDDPRWRVFVDWPGFGWDEISSDVRRISWQRGSSGGDGLGSASPGTATLELYDPTNRYLDTNEASDLSGSLRTGGEVWIALQVSGLTWPIFGGRLKTIVPAASYIPIEQRAQMVMEDEIGRWSRLGRVVSIPAALEGIGAHELREAILDAVDVPSGQRELAPNNDPLIVGRLVTFTDDDGESVTIEAGEEGTPAELLSAVNTATMGRHFVRPGSSTSVPWVYVAIDRNHKIDDDPDVELELGADPPDGYSQLTGWRIGDDTRIGYVVVRPRQWVSGETVEADEGDDTDPSAIQISSDLLPGLSAADGIAEAYAWRFRDERQRPSMLLDGRPRVPLMVERELYDVVSITDPRYHLVARRMEIVGIAGEWSGTTIRMTWTLQDAPQQPPLQRFWRLGRGDVLDDDDLDIGR